MRDQLLMLVQTETVAGVDLARVSAEDIQVGGERVVVRLPEPEVFAVRIADEHSRVYARERGWLVFDPDKDLERRARQQAEAEAREVARQTGLLATARTNAEGNLRTLLHALGFRVIEFRWRSSAI